MNLKLLIALPFMFGMLIPSAAAESPRAAIDEALVGQIWVGDEPPMLPHCKYLTRFDLQRQQRPSHDLSTHVFRCNGKHLIMLASLSAGGESQILDARTLPRLSRGERLIYPGDCEVDGNSDTDFFAVVRFGRRERVDGKTGVRAAWVPDPETGKIQPLSTRRIVCWRPTPP